MGAPINQPPDSDGSQDAAAAHELGLNDAANAIRVAYSEFVEKVQPSIDYYHALGMRAEEIRQQNEKLPP